jgi:hypothetical protein
VYNYSNFKLARSGPNFSLSNLSAYNLEYSFLDEEGEMIRSLQTWAPVDGKVYTFVYSVREDEFEKHLPVIHLMLSSFSVR